VNATHLVIPGYHGSPQGHWQQWLTTQLPGSTLLDGIDWEQPVLATWAGRVRELLTRAPEPLTLVAHSFGCLAAVVATADRPDKVADLILVAPADPARFDFLGLRSTSAFPQFQLEHALPERSLQVSGIVIGSSNDPWLQLEQAQRFAQRWKLDFHDAGAVGHLNIESGHGPWVQGLDLLLQRHHNLRPRRNVLPLPALKKGRGSALAAVRQHTREQQQKSLLHPGLR
jgi:uncharacterized protein